MSFSYPLICPACRETVAMDGVCLGCHHDHVVRRTPPVRRCRNGYEDVLRRLPHNREGEIRAVYEDQTRHYHDALHIGGLWSTWLTLGGDPEDQAILWATAYHDIVYRPGAAKGENEAASELRLGMAALRAGLAPEVLDEAARMIGATADHLRAEGARERLFCDLDLAGFAADYAGFWDNNRLIQREFCHLAPAEMQAGRHAFFAGLLAEPAIFRSGRVPDWWEAQARDNIRRSLLPD